MADYDEEHRRFLGVPYDWTCPTKQRIRSRIWNPDDVRMFPDMGAYR
jgi:hypothetical protein